MSRTNETRSNRGLPAKTLAGMAFTALLALAGFASPAAARWGDDDDHSTNQRYEQHNDRGGRHDNRRDWDREQWRAPPVIYQGYDAPTYYAPPLVYTPGWGLNINIR